LTHGPELGARVRSALPNADAACFGAFVGYGIDFEDVGGRLRLSGCTSGFDNGYVDATTNAYDLELRVHHAWDFAGLSLDLGLGGGATLFSQRFSSLGRTPDRNSVAPFLAVGPALSWELGFGLYGTLDLSAETHFLAVQRSSFEDDATKLSFALRSSFGLGKRF
ncbi:MAG TPA: caspase family protein, partial [Polyangiaceae bacterium]|nr:caspase family protein [Polyangiaceae bacterium]